MIKGPTVCAEEPTFPGFGVLRSQGKGLSVPDVSQINMVDDGTMIKGAYVPRF